MPITSSIPPAPPAPPASSSRPLLPIPSKASACQAKTGLAEKLVSVSLAKGSFGPPIGRIPSGENIAQLVKPAFEPSVYQPEMDALYPLRSENGPIKIRKIAPLSTGAPYFPNTEVKKFISAKFSPDERSTLYHDNLKVEKFTQDDLLASKGHPKRLHCEKMLLGQDKVVARRALSQGTCIGVYAGKIDNFKETSNPLTKSEHSYLIGIRENTCILGDGIMSKMNTIFEFDPGAGYKQSNEGYSAKALWFDVETDSDRFQRTAIVAFFTTRDLSVGEELRWDYNMTPTDIRLTLEGAPAASREALPFWREIFETSRKDSIQKKIDAVMQSPKPKPAANRMALKRP